MKTLYVVRHAKSSWDDSSTPDFERPLNNRGVKDAPKMGQFLAARGIKPDCIVTSTALRARTTAELMAREMGISMVELVLEDGLYEASVSEVLDVVRSFDDSWASAMIFGHNPTFTSFVNTLTQSNIGNVPTCGVAQSRAQADRWTDVGRSPASLVEFFLPKKI